MDERNSPMDATQNQALDTADDTLDHALDEVADLVDETAPGGAATSIHDMGIGELRRRIEDGTLTDEQRAEYDAFEQKVAELTEPTLNEWTRVLQGARGAVGAFFESAVYECVAEGSRDRVLKELLNGEFLDPDADPFEILRHAPSVFADNPDACVRFREWCETDEHTTKNGKVSYKRLAECIQASPRIASKYYQHPEEMKALYAEFLFESVGEQTAYDMMHGWGAYDVDAMEAEKAENIDRIVELLEGMEPGEVRKWLELIAGNPRMFS